MTRCIAYKLMLGQIASCAGLPVVSFPPLSGESIECGIPQNNALGFRLA
jgi:hypothetical protein